MEVKEGFLGSSRSRGHFFCALNILSVQIWSNTPPWYTALKDADNKYIKEGITALEFTSNFTVN